MESYLMQKWGDYTPNQMDVVFRENCILLAYYTLFLPLFYPRWRQLAADTIEIWRFNV